MLKEFEIIDKYFSRLVDKKVSLKLRDDCAFLPTANNLIINVDTIIEEEHFFHKDCPSSIAHKLLNVNLSDIASMGAFPKYWTIGISIPQNSYIDDSWLKVFTTTLEKIQDTYGFFLISGDTNLIRSGKLTITANMFGKIRDKKSPLRMSNACKGDIICVSGYIGDSYWGLQLLKDKYNDTNIIQGLSQEEVDYLIKRYHYPNAKVELGNILLDYANSCTDISDGLWADLDKLCRFSECLGIVNIEDIPFSTPLHSINHINDDIKNIQSICGGDDYELVFSINKNQLKSLTKVLIKKNIFIKEIGYISKDFPNTSQGVKFFKNNIELRTRNKGYNY